MLCQIQQALVSTATYRKKKTRLLGTHPPVLNSTLGDEHDFFGRVPDLLSKRVAMLSIFSGRLQNLFVVRSPEIV